MAAQSHPSLPGYIVPGQHVADVDLTWPVVRSTRRFANAYLNVDEDVIADPTGVEHDRVIVRPHGAVAILAIDAHDRVLMLKHFRHPVGKRMIELPAGTLDMPGEDPLATAQRELREEADIDAGNWQHLAHLTTSPGYTSELWDVFMARDLQPTPVDARTRREAEEADMEQIWVDADEAIAATLDGRITDALTVCGLLAFGRT